MKNKIKLVLHESLIYKSVQAARLYGNLISIAAQNSASLNLWIHLCAFLKISMKNSILGRFSLAGQEAFFLSYLENSVICNYLFSLLNKISFTLTGMVKKSGIFSFINSLGININGNLLRTAGIIGLTACLVNSVMVLLLKIEVTVPAITARFILALFSLLLVFSNGRREDIANNSMFLRFLKNI